MLHHGLSVGKVHARSYAGEDGSGDAGPNDGAQGWTDTMEDVSCGGLTERFKGSAACLVSTVTGRKDEAPVRTILRLDWII